jgi:hypothetical protein
MYFIDLFKPKVVSVTLRIQSVPQRKQQFTVTKINWLILFRKIIAVYSENHSKQINIMSEQNAELLIIKAGGTYSYHWSLKG